MQSTFSGIEIGKRSVFAHSRALEVVGHNMSNASAEGYSRQRIELRATAPIYRPDLTREHTPGQIGQGVEVARIERVRDMLLERRIVAAAGDQSYWRTRSDYVLQLEQVYNEPDETSVRNLLDRFWDGWQELSLYPEQGAARQAVLQRAEALAEGIRLRHDTLSRIGSMLEDEIGGTVFEINALMRDIAALNEEIVRVEGNGDVPNDLLDRRDLLVERLSEQIEIRIDDRDPDEFSIYTRGYHIVQGGIARPFETALDTNTDGYSRVVWTHSGETVQFDGGKLGALIEVRDVDLRREFQALDTLTVNVADLVNEIHRTGYGINGRTGQDFFVQYPAVLDARGNFDADLDGVFDATYLFRVHGANRLQPQAQIGLAGTITLSASDAVGADGLVTIPYQATDTVADVVGRINNSGAEVTARLDREGRLELKATAARDNDDPDFVIRHIEDDGLLLTGYAGLLADSGPAGAFRWDQADAATLLAGVGAAADGAAFAVAPLARPSGWIAVNPDIVTEPRSIAGSFSVAGNPGETGDGSAALAIAALRNGTVGVGQVATLDDYFADTIARIGLAGEEAELALETAERIYKDLDDTRARISGVNIDEELAQMLKFQHGYQAAARFITNIDRMLDTIINRMGA